MMTGFYICAAIALISTFLAISSLNAIHALLYFIVSLLAVGVIFVLMGAPFAAALIIIINAGAIMVLFVFVLMMLNLGPQTIVHEKKLMNPSIWAGPLILAAILMIEFIYIIVNYNIPNTQSQTVMIKEIGLSLFGPYLLAVEMASVLLLAGLLGAYHLARKEIKKY